MWCKPCGGPMQPLLDFLEASFSVVDQDQDVEESSGGSGAAGGHTSDESSSDSTWKPDMAANTWFQVINKDDNIHK